MVWLGALSKDIVFAYYQPMIESLASHYASGAEIPAAQSPLLLTPFWFVLLTGSCLVYGIIYLTIVLQQEWRSALRTSALAVRLNLFIVGMITLLVCAFVTLVLSNQVTGEAPPVSDFVRLIFVALMGAAVFLTPLLWSFPYFLMQKIFVSNEPEPSLDALNHFTEEQSGVVADREHGLQ